MLSEAAKQWIFEWMIVQEFGDFRVRKMGYARWPRERHRQRRWLLHG